MDQLIPRPNIPQALLITGPTDVIWHALQAELKQLLCENNTGEHGNDDCPSCQLFQSEGGHPDLLSVEPEGKMNIIKIDRVRETTLYLEQSALRGGYKIAVIVDADAMNVAAQNALLKSLEEPGAKKLIILISALPHRLLATIRSRCQTVQYDVLYPSHDAQNIKLAQFLLEPFDPLEFTLSHKDLNLLDYTRTQIQLIYDIVCLQLGQTTVHFTVFSPQLLTLASTLSTSALLGFYQSLIEKTRILQNKIAINEELYLFELALAWKRIINQNSSTS